MNKNNITNQVCSALPEVHLTPGQITAKCPVCAGLWDKEHKPDWFVFPDKMVMPTGPHCPYCIATVRIFIDLPNKSVCAKSGGCKE